jgi:glycosyltransferase involved in cell wall biosynthesis
MKRVVIAVPHGQVSSNDAFIERIKNDVEIVAILSPQLSRFMKFIMLLISFSPIKNTWFRKWMRLREKTPFAFDNLTKKLEKMNRELKVDYDLMIHFGAMMSPVNMHKPYIIITDSTRNLTQNNKYDIWGKFKNESLENNWIKRETAVYQNACNLIVGCNEVKNSMTGFYKIPENKITVNPFIINEAYEIDISEKVYDGKTILIVAKGQFKMKGGTDTLKAYEIVKKKIPDARLLIVGQDSVGDYQQDGVTCYGLLRDKDKLKNLYKQANVFVLPSYIDRFGMSIVEAMSAATPCIVANYRAQPDIVGDTGYVVELGDYQKIAEHIIQLLSDNTLSKEKGTQAYDRYRNALSWNARKRVMMGIIESCSN